MNSRNPGPPAGAAPRPRPAASRSARPAPPPPPGVPRPAPPVPRAGQPAPHTTAAPHAASPNQTMITMQTTAPTRRRSTGGVTGYLADSDALIQDSGPSDPRYRPSSPPVGAQRGAGIRLPELESES